MLEHIGNEVKYKENREKRSMTEYKRLGDYIREVNVRNRELKVTNLLGVSISKEFMPSIANTIGTDMSAYKIVDRGQFAYGPVTSRNEDFDLEYWSEHYGNKLCIDTSFIDRDINRYLIDTILQRNGP